MSKKTVTHINLVGSSATPATSRKRKVASKKTSRRSKSRNTQGKSRNQARSSR
jgi:hypothetical protein